MIITLDLTKNELEVLQKLVYENPCCSGCRKEYKRKPDDYCDIGCPFNDALWSLAEKVEKIRWKKN